VKTAVALLSHRFGNIGHNFMALGAEAIARQSFGDDVEIVHYEQHHPFRIYPEGHWLRLVDKVPHGRLRWIRRYFGRASVYEKYRSELAPMPFNLAVACGGPNLVAGASQTPEMRILMHHFNGAFASKGVPLVDMAVGSSFPLEGVPARLAPEDEQFYKTTASFARVTTVRDLEARRLYGTIGVDAPVIPCAAIGSGRYFETFRAPSDSNPDDGDVIVNFQAKGANTDWGQNVSATEWAALVAGVVGDLSKDGHRILLLCHSAYEERIAHQLVPGGRVVFPKTEAEYGEAVRNAKVGFVSRLHAGIALAGIGVPSLVVGNDTRIGSTELMGLPSIFSKKLTRESALATLRELIRNNQAERQRLLALRENTINQYTSIFQAHKRDATS